MLRKRVMFTWLFDSIIALILFLLACAIAGLLDYGIPCRYPDFYMLWFAIGMIPCYRFAVWRSAITSFDRYDVIAFAPLLIGSALMPDSVFEFQPAFYALALVIFGLCCDRVRHWMPAKIR